ncbi:MAG: dicarboxylate/amino acid:cation symporter [Lachnospiraceae bacterium]|nr:dicarboxylate/amino acid:cation symporter [Lachnospiraceae bacterium]
MILGAIFGLIFGNAMVELEFIGTIWLNCIKLIVVPMVLMTIITGITSQKDIKTLGRIAIRIMVYYVATTIIASLVGMLVAGIIQPGKYANFTGLEAKEVTGEIDITVAQFFTNMFSANMFVTFADSNILQTVVIAVMLGVSIMLVKNEEHREKLIAGCDALCSMVFSLIGIIMKASPVGIFFLMGASFGKYGAGIFTSMATLLGTYYFACLVHIVVVYGSILFVGAGINPFKFIKDSAELWIYTLSTCSSVAAIPVNIKVAREKYNVPDRISSFTVPLGSQMNYDGSVLLYGCVIMFICQVCGQPISIAMILRVVLLSAILSTGGGGIPGSGIVKLLVVVEAFSLPTEIVGIIAAFYRLFDMGTTTNNCLGDLAGTVLISRLEEKHAVRN